MNTKIRFSIALSISFFAVSFNANAAITSISPKQIIGGMGQVLTIAGSGFGASQGDNYISFYKESAVYMNTTEGASLKYISWSDTKIEMEMPVAFSNKIKIHINGTDYYSTDTLKVKANLGYRHVNPLDYIFLNNRNTKGGYTWHMHRVYWENPLAKAAIEDVFKELRCETGINYILSPDPSDATLTLGDNINLIAPDSVLNAAGYNDRLWASCILGGVTFYQTSTMDIRLSTKLNWYYGKGKVPGGKAKFRYVLMHELGHSLGLSHVNEKGQTMYPSVTDLPSNYWSETDTITKDEKIAISHFVNLSRNFTFSACGISPLLKNVNCEGIYGKASIAGKANDSKKNIYPNPGNGQFITGITKGQIEIYNTQGVKVYSDTRNGNTPILIDISNQPKGIYYMNLINETKSSMFKLIIQ